jgi:hypothetical protein
MQKALIGNFKLPQGRHETLRGQLAIGSTLGMLSIRCKIVV